VASVVAVVPDLLFGSKVQALLQAGGHDVAIVARPEQAAGADVVVADLASGDVEPEAVEGARRLAIYSHVDVATKERAEAAGFDLVVPRSRFVREGAALVDRLAAN
jgi:nucleoside-diphosphate-sugar epimerase